MYMLSDLLIEASLADDTTEALSIGPDVRINGHDSGGLTNPQIIPDDDGAITLEYNGTAVTLTGK